LLMRRLVGASVARRDRYRPRGVLFLFLLLRQDRRG
jgi:hypothetical protein